MSDKKGGGARLADHRCYGLMVAAAYGVVSITITLFNKAVFNFYEFKFPLTLFVAQMLFSLVFVSLPPRPPGPRPRHSRTARRVHPHPAAPRARLTRGALSCLGRMAAGLHPQDCLPRAVRLPGAHRHTF